MAATRRFQLILLKPSHYDDDGYVIQWLRSTIPSNSLAALYGLALDCQQRHALGEDPARYRREATASGVMMIPIPRRGIYRGVDGADAARAVPHVDDVRITAKADQLLVPLPEGASYLGFIFGRGTTPEGAEESVRQAHQRLTFAVSRELTVYS